MQSLFDTALNSIVLIFLIAIVSLIMYFVIAGYIYPMSISLTPINEQGMTAEQYTTTASHLFTGMQYIFYIILAIPFVYILMKFLFEKEETSVSWT